MEWSVLTASQSNLKSNLTCLARRFSCVNENHRYIGGFLREAGNFSFSGWNGYVDGGKIAACWTTDFAD